MIWLHILAHRSSKDLAKYLVGNAQTSTSEPPGGDEGYATLFPLVGWRKETRSRKMKSDSSVWTEERIKNMHKQSRDTTVGR